MAGAGANKPASGEWNREVLHCVRSLLQGGDVDEAQALLKNEAAGKLPPAEVGQAYHSLVEVLLSQDRGDDVSQVLMEMYSLGQDKCEVLTMTQELVFKAVLQAQHYSRALEILRAACNAGTVLDHAVFNAVLDATVRARSYTEGWDCLELLLGNKRRADKYFVAILTKSLEAATEKRLIRRGINLVEQFIDQQREDVDEIVFNSLLNVLGNFGDMAKLQQTLQKMTDYNVPPSAITYGTVVKAYGRAQDIDAVLSVWQEMRNRRLGVNPVTCGCVLDACVKCGHLDKAMTIFQEMKMQGLHKNTVLYATLIKGFAKARNLQGAVQLYQEMRYENVPCNLVAFNSLMDVCVRCGDLQTAAYFLQDMMNAGIEPDLITFSTLIKGYSQTGEVQKAMMLARELKARGLKCDEIMYNSLIDGCARATKLEEGLEIFRDMVQSRVPPSNITFSILIKLHFESGHAMEAFRLVEEMGPRYRCVPSRVVYAVLFRCAAQHGGEALQWGVTLLGELAARRNSKLPDQSMVSAIVQGLVQHANWPIAVRVVKEFTGGANRRGNCLVSLESLKMLVGALGSTDQAAGLDLIEHLRQRPLGATHLSQLQTALAEGQRAPPAPPAPVPAHWSTPCMPPSPTAQQQAGMYRRSAPPPPLAQPAPYPSVFDWSQQFLPPQPAFMPECLPSYASSYTQPPAPAPLSPVGYMPVNTSVPYGHCYAQGSFPSPPGMASMCRDGLKPLVSTPVGQTVATLPASQLPSPSGGPILNSVPLSTKAEPNSRPPPRRSVNADKENEAPDSVSGSKKGHQKGRPAPKSGNNQNTNQENHPVEVRNPSLLI